jgi:hypothetical protein
MTLRIFLGTRVDGRPARTERGRVIVAALEGGETFLNGRSLCVPFPHANSIAGR